MRTPSEGAAPGAELSFRVRAGQLESDESWVYAWFSEADRGVVYLGATRLPPAVRIWLHLNDPDPDLGRVAARLPQARDEDFDVLAVRVPVGENRARVRDELVEALNKEGLLSGRYAGPQPGALTEPACAKNSSPVALGMVEAIRRKKRGPRSG